MFFRDIPYKNKEKELLLKQVKDSRIPHAQLFLGKEGSGALSLALAFVSYLVCTNRSNDDSCGNCQSCKQSHKYIYPDIHWAYPVVKADGKNRDETTSDDFLPKWRETIKSNPYLNVFDWSQTIDAGNTKPNINVKECNSIMQKLALQSFADGPKILLMWLPEYLGKEGNRLLKLIEEPTPDTIIILVAENQGKILNTVLSRCQLVKVLPYQESEIANYLKEESGLQEGRAEQIAKLAEGNINKAIHITNGEEKNLAEVLFSWLRTAYKSDAIEMQKMSFEMADWSKDLQLQFLNYGLHFLREYLFSLLTGRIPNLTVIEIETANNMKTIIDQDKVEKLSLLLENAIGNINRNANMKISYMANTILIGDILKNINVNLQKEINFV